MPDDKLPKANRDTDSEKDLVALEKIILNRRAKVAKEKALEAVAAEKIKKAFDADKTVNGIRIVVKWDEKEDGYVIFLPQIDLRLERETGVYVQMARITDNPSVAADIFKYACRKAEQKEDVYKIYNSALSLSKALV